MQLSSTNFGFINYIDLHAGERQITVHMATVSLWLSEDKLWELIFFLTMCMGPGVGT